MSNFIKGNQFQLFYHNGTAWKALAYATSHSYSVNDNYEDVACKEFGLYPEKDLTSSGVEVSGEYIYSDEAFGILSGMLAAHKEYTFCFAKINTWAETGYDISSETPSTTIAKYFNAMVSVEISSEANSNATMSVTLTGSSAPVDTAPTASSTTPPKLVSYTASK